MKTLIQLSAIGVAVLALTASGCKNAEKKRRGDDSSKTAPADPGKTTQAQPGATKSPGAASPHGAPTKSPHGGPGAPGPGAAGPAVGGKVVAQPTAEDGSKVIGPLSVIIPKSWKESPPSSGMRLAQWSIGDKDPAELVAYHFPGGGSIDANLDRWYGQFKQPDGSNSKDKAVRKDEVIDGFKVTTANVKGHYVAAMRPGQPGAHDKKEHQMLAAIISTDKGPIFLKMIGPESTVTATEKDWAQFISSIKKSK